jgi:DNA-binding protein YbaB
MSDDANRVESLLNKSVPDKPGKPTSPPAPATPPPTEDDPRAAFPAPSGVGGTPFGAETPARSSLHDMRSPVVEFEEVADEMQRYAANLTTALTSAAERTYEITSDDGAVTVTVDGRPRVRRIRFDPRAMRGKPEDLAAKLIISVNEAVRTARQQTYDELLDTLDPAMRSAIRDGAADAERIVPGEDQQ